MSNFLNRLVTRSLAGAEEIQPRPVSLFESPAINHLALDPPLAAIAPNQDTTVSRIGTSGFPALSQTPSVSAVSSPTVRPTITPPPSPTPHSTVSTDAIVHNSSPSPLSPRPQTIDSQASISQPQYPSVLTESNPQVSLNQVQAQYSISEQSQVTTSDNSDSLQTHLQQFQRSPLSTPETTPLNVESPSLEAILAATPPSSATSVGTLVQPLVKPFAQPETSSNPPQSASPPMIRVTIDRIDVRAITPPNPTPSRRSPPVPKLSLADYLKQRPGGKG